MRRMRRSTGWRAIAVSVAALGLASCRLGRSATPRALPNIPVYEITPSDTAGISIVPAPARDSAVALSAAKLVSLTASNADARTLLLWLAEQAGVDLVVAPDVTARVSVSFNNVPAGEAMRAIMAEAGLSVLMSGLNSPWPPVVFFRLPANINEASADEIVALFGVSPEMASWIVESRTKP
jgi:hypothetical protein